MSKRTIKQRIERLVEHRNAGKLGRRVTSNSRTQKTAMKRIKLAEQWATANFKRLAGEWALESGLVGELVLGEPTPVKNTRRKRMSIHVTDAKGRTAICTFTADGSRDMYERTDRSTG
jgi:hypothetical protein